MHSHERLLVQTNIKYLMQPVANVSIAQYFHIYNTDNKLFNLQLIRMTQDFFVKTKTLIFVREAPRDQDLGLQD